MCEKLIDNHYTQRAQIKMFAYDDKFTFIKDKDGVHRKEWGKLYHIKGLYKNKIEFHEKLKNIEKVFSENVKILSEDLDKNNINRELSYFLEYIIINNIRNSVFNDNIQNSYNKIYEQKLNEKNIINDLVIIKYYYLFSKNFNFKGSEKWNRIIKLLQNTQKKLLIS